MTVLKDFAKELKSMTRKMRKGAKKALLADSRVIMSEFQARSPVDTGEYKAGWKLGKGRFTAANVITSVSISNRSVGYASVMEYGAGIKQHPWFYSPQQKRKSGKLKVSGGRVWAGGLKPGHSSTVKGAIDPALYQNNRRLRLLAKNIADGIIGGLTG